MGSFWRPIRLSHDASNLPPLLIKYDFGLANYTVLVTDFTYIWTEHLDRKQILRRALDLDPSIDPSEDADQMHQFLRNVRDSLAGEGGTKLSLSRGDTPKQLVLNTFTPLPASLVPLEWPMYLDPADQNVLTTEFVLPCLSQQLNAKAQIDTLLQHLKEKDHVINRLTQKMEFDGLDFSKIFPSVAVSKAVNRSDSRKSCADLVKGLGKFDEEDWRKCSTTHSSSLADIVLGLFAPGITGIPDVVSLTSKFSTWWDHLGDKRDLERKAGSEHLDHRLMPKQNTTVPEDDLVPDKEFQVCRSRYLDLKA